jgi:hypothetical protein
MSCAWGRHYARWYSAEFWKSVTKVFPLVNKMTSHVTTISKQWEVVISWRTAHETEETQDKSGFSSWYRNSKYDKVHIGLPAEVLLSFDKQRRFKTREPFVTANIVETIRYKWNDRKTYFESLTFHNINLRYRTKERRDMRRPIQRTD